MTQTLQRRDLGIAVIGCGRIGTLRAVMAANHAAVRYIAVADKDAARAQKLATDLGGPIRAYPWEERHALLEGSAMVVNTTSQGMVGNPALDLALDKLSSEAGLKPEHKDRWALSRAAGHSLNRAKPRISAARRSSSGRFA